MADAKRDDDTVASFPTYAALARTSAWSGSSTRSVREGLDESAGAVLAAAERYTEGALLGVGGMGKVVLAHDARIGRDVAVKQLHAERQVSADDSARFLREARVQGQLEHPSIVPVYDIDRRPDGTTFFTMRRVLGRTLHDILEDLRAGHPAARARYTQRELLTAFATVCLTIDYAHSRGVIHRDLKPANIMLGDFGEVYVLDWGLARLLDGSERVDGDGGERLSMTGELLGTPLYMAPEQMVDPDVGVGADVFALGAILFEVLTFERLRDATTLYLPAEARASVRAPERGVAPELETICVRATESAAADRHPSARALHAEIVKFLEGDRELEQRRQLADVHAGRARDALARAEEAGRDPDHERGVAVRELRDAVALHPAAEHVGALGTLLTTPPRTIPPAVHAEMRNETERVIHRGAVFSVIGMASWFMFFPVMYVIGIRDYLQVALIAVPALISIAASIIAVRQRVISRSLQYVTVGFMLLGAMGASRVLGPLVLMPTLIVSYAIVLQAHPARRFRRIGLVGGIVALTVPFALELVGVIPSSYGFLDGNMLIRPQLMALPAVWTEVFLAITNLTMIVVPCVFISRLRAELSDAQTRQLVQAWQFKRLGGEPVEARV